MKKKTDTTLSTEVKESPEETSKKNRLALPASVKGFLGEKPLIHYSHRTALKLFESLGFKFEVRRFGESRIGLLRWSLRKLTAAKTPRRLVLVPGFGDTPLSWIGVVAGMKPILKREFDEVLICDFPGNSGFLHEEAAFDSMDELLRCFHEVMDSLRPDAILGHSLGGWLAGDYAIENGKKSGSLKHLILVDPGGVLGTEEQRQAYRGLFDTAIEKGGATLLPHLFHKKPIWASFLFEEFTHFLKAPEIRAFLQSIEERHVLNDRVGAIRAKTTILWGENDRVTLTSWMDYWMRLLPKEANASGVLIKGSGHSPQVEKPGVLIALLTQIFLGRKPLEFPRMPFWRVLKPGAGVEA